MGKSTLINQLCNRKELAKVSDKPGKTQLINHFHIISKGPEGTQLERRLADLPGYGYAKVSKTQRFDWEDMIVEFLSHRGLDTIFVLIDISIPPQQIDLDFLARLDRQELPFQIVFTKSDKITQKVLYANQKSFLSALVSRVRMIPQYYVTSKEKKFSTQDLLGAIEELTNSAHANAKANVNAN